MDWCDCFPFVHWTYTRFSRRHSNARWCLCSFVSCQGMEFLDCAEFFAGHKAVSLGLVEAGYRTASFERDDHVIFEDFLSPRGYFYALSIIMRLVPGKSIAWYAPVCSSWSWASRSRTCRSYTEPYGAPIPCVLSANCMVSRPKSEWFKQSCISRRDSQLVCRCRNVLHTLYKALPFMPPLRFKRDYICG